MHHLRPIAFCILTVYALAACGKQKLTYDNAYEENLFTHYFADPSSVDPAKFLIAIHYSQNLSNAYQSNIGSLKYHLNQQKIDKKEANKKAKAIVRLVKNEKLKSYNETATFDQLVNYGTYNTETLSALYCILLDHFEVGHELFCKPHNCYIIADPLGSKIPIETKSAVAGSYAYFDTYKSNFVAYLERNRDISYATYRSVDKDELFTRYHDTFRKINLTQLAGMLYYNHALDLYNQHKQVAAFKQIKKANALYPNNEIIEFLLYESYIYMLNDDVSKIDFKAERMAEFLNQFPLNTAAQSQAKAYYNKAASPYLRGSNSISEFQKFNEALLSHFSKKVDPGIYQLQYYRIMTNHYIDQGNSSMALRSLHKAYELDTDDTGSKKTIESLATVILNNTQEYVAAIDTAHKFLIRYPFLKSNKGFMKDYYFNLAKQIELDYKNKQQKQGAAYLNQFESLLQDKHIVKPDSYFTEAIYASASFFHYTQRDFDQARTYVKTGLAYCPDSKKLRNFQDKIPNY